MGSLAIANAIQTRPLTRFALTCMRSSEQPFRVSGGHESPVRYISSSSFCHWSLFLHALVFFASSHRFSKSLPRTLPSQR